MGRDSFDMFAPPDRGRFGDNESQSDKPERLRGESRLHDVTMIHHVDLERPRAVYVSQTEDRSKGVWLPRSQIEILDIGPAERKLRGIVVQPVKITLPEWLAKDKGLV